MKEYILREEVLRCVEEDGRDCELDLGYYDHNVAFQEIIKDIPASDVVEVRHGKWIPVTNGRGGSECNLCHAYAPSYQSGAEYNSPYCPNCGAKMDGGANDAAD